MTSEKQIRANRRNALKSTGPKTPERKAGVRHNATKHGLLSREVLLPGEDEEALKQLGENLRAELQPLGELENLLMDRIIAAVWRLRRLGRVEAGLFARELYGELTRRAQREARRYEREESKDHDFLRSLLPTTTITDKKKHREAVSKIKEMQALRESETATLGQTFVQDADGANAFSKLSRYESALERSLFKALHELQRLQAARRAEGNVSPPVPVDLNVSGGSS